MRCFALIYLLSFNFFISAQDTFSVGTWRDHLPYAKINEVVILDDIYYAASPYSIISFDSNENEIKKWNTITGLSEVGVTSIEANENQHTLVVGYQSGNIDLIQNNDIVNMSAILNSGVIGDKSIYEIVAHNDFVYVCTGFGIVLIDLKKKEVKDTYFIGDNNSLVKVWDAHVGQDSIFASTDFGIKAASLSNSFLSDPSVWNYITNPTNKLFTKIENNEFTVTAN